MKNFTKILIICFYIFGISSSLADDKKIGIKTVYKLLQEKKFQESIKNLQILSEENNLNAQLLYSKILFSGEITPQNFEKSYFWGFSALLGGLKKSSMILDELDNYLEDKHIEMIKIELKEFLEKRAFAKDKRAIVQLAKLFELFTEPPDMVNAYTWYSIAVAQGIKTAKSKRDEVLENINEKDLLDAQALSIKLFKRIND
tara:strand:+ start:15 stop:617 length:603 start_codon:yes stop_codon:yes gene_type:complete